MTLEICKQRAAEKALTFVQPKMVIGLGTGSTAAYFIKALIKRCQEGLDIITVASSEASARLARQGHLPLADINQIDTIDLYVDGADEIDDHKKMIKGGGGALLREKILAHMSRHMIIIADETKLVKKLGHRPLPIEILPFGFKATISHLTKLGLTGLLRKTADGQIWITENQNYLYDIALPTQASVESVSASISIIPGVIETGFFPSPANQLIIGYLNGKTEIF